MKALSVLSALLFPLALGACIPEPESSTPVLPPPHAPVVAPPVAEQAAVPAPADSSAIRLTTFELTTNDIYCSFHRPSHNGVLGERLFITEFDGVPALGTIGLEGEAVSLEQVSKTETGRNKIWNYRNAERPIEVELRLREVDDGREYQSYTGTIRITAPVDADAINIEGSCRV